MTYFKRFARGAAFILAILAFTQPLTLITFIGIYAVVDGVLKLFSGFGDQPDGQSRWPAASHLGVFHFAGAWSRLPRRLNRQLCLCAFDAARCVAGGTCLREYDYC